MSAEPKVALVTGGAKRVGRAIALKLAAAGMNIALHYHTSAEAAVETAQAVGEIGGEAVLLQGDLTVVAEAEGMVDAAATRWGRLDVLVNNASIFERTPIGGVNEAQWDALLDTNLKGPFFCAQRAGGLMRQAGSGVIINLIDTGVYRAWAGYVPYLVSKAGLEQLTYGLAKALAPTVRVNGVAPGPALPAEGDGPDDKERARQRTLLGRLGGAEAIAEAVLYLVQAEFVTGVVLPVDGGQRWK
jgi:pteridine reductase